MGRACGAALRVAGSTAVLFAGYGLFLCAYCGGPLSLAYLTAMREGWGGVLFAQFAYLAGLGIGCVLLGTLDRRWDTPRPVAGVLLCTTVSVACLVAGWGLGSLGIAAGLDLSMLAAGAATAYPLMLWCSLFLTRCRGGERSRTVALLAAAELVPIAASLTGVAFPNLSGTALVFMVAATVGSAVCQTALARRDGVAEALSGGSSRQGEGGRYRLTAYSRGIIACFGVTWGLACCIATYSNATGSPSMSVPIVVLTSAVACVAVAAVVRRFAGHEARFGGFVRFSMVATGIVLVLTPVLRELLPELFYPLCEVVFIFGEIVVVLFSIDVCAENGLRVFTVMPANQALFVASACCAAVLFGLSQVFVGGQTAWELVAVIGAVAVMGVVPVLPSRTSDAMAFTLETLPEDEGYDARIELRRSRLAAKYGLVEREEQVLEYLLQGMTRQQIAQQLNLSPWTIKDRIGAIYEKTGVHSYKELVRLVEDA